MNFRKNRALESLLYGVPDDKDAKKLIDRLLKYEAEYFWFVDESILPNNTVEQALRKVTVSRKTSQGTRSDQDARWLERFWSVETTSE